MAKVFDRASPHGRFGPGKVPFARVPDHEMIQVVGRGGGGEVWLAKNALGVFRAVKIVHATTFRNRRPFEREFNGVKKFEPLSRLHDGLMDVLQVGRDDADGYFYCVMELADDVHTGQAVDPLEYSPRTLAADLARYPQLPTTDCLRIGADIAAALKFLHERGLIHRDIKPSNIVFVNGVPKLADIGLVTDLAEAKSFVGTEGFIPPEGPGTIQADIYSLGKVLYEISTGKDRRDYPELPTQFNETVHDRELAELNKIILKACRPNPRERYESAEAMMNDLLAVQRGGLAKAAHARKQTLNRLVWTGGVTAAFSIAAWLILPHRKPSGPELPLLPSPGKALPVPAAVSSGLVAWWPGEDDAIDSVSGRSETLLNGATIVKEGKVGGALLLDGVDDHMRIADRPALRITGPMTIEGWLYPTTNDTTRNIVAKWDAVAGLGQKSYVMGCYPRGRLYFSVSPTGADSSAFVSSRTQVPLNEWSHVAGVYDGRHLKVYINGQLNGQIDYSDGIFPGTCDLAIGGSVGGLTAGKVIAPFGGRVDELSIYRRDLSDAEILAICAAGSLGKKPPLAMPVTSIPPGLVGWWRAEGDARDAVNGHDGVLMNGASFAFGKSGQAFRLDGKDDYIKVPWARDLDVGQEVTMAFWMKADPGNFMDECCQGLISSDFYSVEIAPAFTDIPGIDFFVYTDVGVPLSKISEQNPRPSMGCAADTNGAPVVVSSGEWHHVAATYDGAGLQLYIDGVAWGKKQQHTGAIFPMLPGSFLAFGSEDGRKCCSFCSGRYFKGLLDEVRIFNRALSAAEISGLRRSDTNPDLTEVAHATKAGR